jgi:hypothetical protein
LTKQTVSDILKANSKLKITMKKVFVFLILATLLWVGCEKTPVVPPIPPVINVSYRTVLVSQKGKGTVNPDTLTKVVYGESLTITATPDSGYSLYSLKVISTVPHVGVEEKEVEITPTESPYTYILSSIKANTEVRFEFIETDNLIISILEPPLRLKDISTFSSDGTYLYSSVLLEHELSLSVYFYYPEGKLIIYWPDGTTYFSAGWYLKEGVLHFGGNPYPIVELTPTKLAYKDVGASRYVLYTYER